jgi:glycosyltransferase involved in cell wall biosynthesis
MASSPSAEALLPRASRGSTVAGFVSVVLPCLDEAHSVGLCVEEARTALAGANIAGEVLVVDNGSSDGSPEIAEAAGARVVHQAQRGYGNALQAGFDAARGEIIIMADADFSYDLTKIPELLAPIRSNEADLVVGSRFDAATRRTMPLLHRFVGTPVLTFLTARACGRRVINDSQSGFRAFRRDILAVVNLRSTGMELASEMLIQGARAGLRITEVDTGYRPRIGESKLAPFSDGWRHIQLILLLAPDLLLLFPGFVLLGFGLLLLVVGFVSPSGVDVGSLRWQPVFFSGIALVLGVQALAAGAVLAHYSSVTTRGIGERFAFVGRPSFPGRCLAVGLLMAAGGLTIDFVLFLLWLKGEPSPPLRGSGLASLAQSLIIVGGTAASFGIVTRFLRARGSPQT